MRKQYKLKNPWKFDNMPRQLDRFLVISHDSDDDKTIVPIDSIIRIYQKRTNTDDKIYIIEFKTDTHEYNTKTKNNIDEILQQLSTKKQSLRYEG